jgi:hypothetical protein
MVECGLPKAETRVRFPSPAPLVLIRFFHFVCVKCVLVEVLLRRIGRFLFFKNSMPQVFVGRAIMESQLRGILDRRDWLLISISAASPSALATNGVQIGIVQLKAGLGTGCGETQSV